MFHNIRILQNHENSISHWISKSLKRKQLLPKNVFNLYTLYTMNLWLTSLLCPEYKTYLSYLSFYYQIAIAYLYEIACLHKLLLGPFSSFYKVKQNSYKLINAITYRRNTKGNFILTTDPKLYKVPSINGMLFCNVPETDAKFSFTI